MEDTLIKEIEQKNYVLAVMLAQKLGHPENEIRLLKELALKQMACEYRNGIAARKLAREWRFSKTELENLLRTALEEYKQASDKRLLEQVYDTESAKYLTLQQWVEQFLSRTGN